MWCSKQTIKRYVVQQEGTCKKERERETDRESQKAPKIGPDFPSIETRQLGRGFQIGAFRPIRVDHTNCLQVVIKTHSFINIYLYVYIYIYIHILYTCMYKYYVYIYISIHMDMYTYTHTLTDTCIHIYGDMNPQSLVLSVTPHKFLLHSLRHRRRTVCR